MSPGSGVLSVLRFDPPEPPRIRPRLRPVFLPLAGCPGRCVYCHQPLQTGTPAGDLAARLEDLERDLEEAAFRNEPPCGLGFYGGTFTSLPGDWTWRFLDLAARFRARGRITGLRASTRPDAVFPGLLAELRARGLDLLELGIQSFDDAALEASGRGYSGNTARAACVAVRHAGLGLGVQLLPGLPGDRPGVFRRDVDETVGLRPDCARLYPCLVLAGTPLEGLWRRGEYAPWTPGRARAELSLALSRLWRARIAVIRLGLAPEPGLARAVLAGPAHPALGQQARSLALLDHVRRHLARLGRAPRRLIVPARFQGEFWGHARSLERAWARLGLTPERVVFTPVECFELS